MDRDAPAAKKLTFSAWIRMHTETSTSCDKLTILVGESGASGATKWTKNSSVASKYGEATFDLTSYAGKKVDIRFYFTTVDGVGNSGYGVFVDDVTITRTCP